MTNHYPLACSCCASCIREGGEERRLGSAVIVIWTRVGPLTLTLCGRCARKGLQTITDEHFGVDSPFLDAIYEKE